VRPHSPRWLSVAEVAAKLDYTPRYVRMMCAAGRFPAKRFGRRGWWRIDLHAVKRMGKENGFDPYFELVREAQDLSDGDD
jgi:excisionase family DNA binding protein